MKIIIELVENKSKIDKLFCLFCVCVLLKILKCFVECILYIAVINLTFKIKSAINKCSIVTNCCF